MNFCINLLFLVLGSLGSDPVRAESSVPAGVPVSHLDVVQAWDTDVYEIFIFAGQTKHITVRGQSVTDLDLFIYDEHDNLIVSDTDSSSLSRVWVRAYRSGSFFIHVKNLGGSPNVYTIDVR